MNKRKGRKDIKNVKKYCIIIEIFGLRELVKNDKKEKNEKNQSFKKKLYIN